MLNIEHEFHDSQIGKLASDLGNHEITIPIMRVTKDDTLKRTWIQLIDL